MGCAGFFVFFRMTGPFFGGVGCVWGGGWYADIVLCPMDKYISSLDIDKAGLALEFGRAEAARRIDEIMELLEKKGIVRRGLLPDAGLPGQNDLPE